MRITEITVKNFRLLCDVTLGLERDTTVIVGRNNSGKTSLAELFRRILTEKSPSFHLEDFSLCTHYGFWDAYVAARAGGADEAVAALLPVIEVRISISYDSQSADLGPLGPFIIDLDTDCSEAIVAIRYQVPVKHLAAFFDGLAPSTGIPRDDDKLAFYRVLRDRIPSFYSTAVLAQDPRRADNTKTLEWSNLKALLQSGFINAQRGLDDTTHRERDVIGRLLEALFATAASSAAGNTDRSAADALTEAVQDVQSRLDLELNENLKSLLPAFSLFGYPGLGDPNLRTETTLDVTRLLSNHTKVRYAGSNGITLPEAYNGLGSRNLILILLQLVDFFRRFRGMQSAPGVHLVFIEEPEAHLHPQMAEVFIRKLKEIALVLTKQLQDEDDWPVQFIVSTHSTHMANEAPFEAMRYFLATPENEGSQTRQTRIKDLRKGLGRTSAEDRKFLHQYMTLTRCDLLFADKAALIEGTTERLLFPRMIERHDKEHPDGHLLSSQYVSLIEVGGAYAHIFFPLLDFLELQTLIVTDLDPASPNAKKKLEGCTVSESTTTTNGCIKKWFAAESKVSCPSLLSKSADEKTRGFVRLAYQVPEEEGGPCGRSFEDAFMLANPSLFTLGGKSASVIEKAASDAAENVKKSEFALKYAIEVEDWVTPRYIAEGLAWLAQGTGPRLPEPATVRDELATASNGVSAEGIK